METGKIMSTIVKIRLQCSLVLLQSTLECGSGVNQNKFVRKKKQNSEAFYDNALCG